MTKFNKEKIISEFTKLMNDDKTGFLKSVFEEYNNHDINNDILVDFIVQIQKEYDFEYVSLGGTYFAIGQVCLDDYNTYNLGKPIIRCEQFTSGDLLSLLKRARKDIIIPNETLQEIVRRLNPLYGEKRLLTLEIFDTPVLKADIHEFPNREERSRYINKYLRNRIDKNKKVKFHALPLKMQRDIYKTVYKYIKGDG